VRVFRAIVETLVLAMLNFGHDLAPDGAVAGADLAAENARLRRENERLRMEREILKNRRGTRPPVGIETVVLYPGCGRERPSTFWWRVTP